eukprot:scaffold129276_cov36-Phaeocystis_antarctica.AAC.2
MPVDEMPDDAVQFLQPCAQTRHMQDLGRSQGASFSMLMTTVVRVLAESASLNMRPPLARYPISHRLRSSAE